MATLYEKITTAKARRLLGVSMHELDRLESVGMLRPIRHPRTGVRFWSQADIMQCRARLDTARTGGAALEHSPSEPAGRQTYDIDLDDLSQRARPLFVPSPEPLSTPDAVHAVTQPEQPQRNKPQSIADMILDGIHYAIDSIDADKAVMVGAILLASSPRAERLFDRFVDAFVGVTRSMVDPPKPKNPDSRLANPEPEVIAQETETDEPTKR